MILWMYPVVVRPILARINRTEVNKIQRTASASATGSSQSYPALNVLRHLLVIDLYISLLRPQ